MTIYLNTLLKNTPLSHRINNDTKNIRHKIAIDLKGAELSRYAYFL